MTYSFVQTKDRYTFIKQPEFGKPDDIGVALEPEQVPIEVPAPEQPSMFSFSPRPQPSGILGTLPGDIPKPDIQDQIIPEVAPVIQKNMDEIGFNSPLLGGMGTKQQQKDQQSSLNTAADTAYGVMDTAVDAWEPFFMSPADEKAMMAEYPNAMAARYAAASLLLPGVSEKLASPEELERFVSQPKEHQQQEILGIAAGYALFGAAGKGAKALLGAAAKRYPVLAAQDWWQGLFGSKAGKYGPEWLRKATNKERGLVVQNMDEAIKGMKTQGMSEGQIFREVKKTFGNEKAYNLFAKKQGIKPKGETPSPEPIVPTETGGPVVPKPVKPVASEAIKAEPTVPKKRFTIVEPKPKTEAPLEIGATPDLKKAVTKRFTVVDKKPVKPIEPPVKDSGDIKIKTEPDGDKTVKVEMPKSEADALTPKEQKQYLLKEVDAALKAAPDDFQYSDDTILIEVPGDGEFKIQNTKFAIAKFKKNAKKFPGSVQPPHKTKRFKGTTKQGRPEGEGIEYYNEYSPRKQGLLSLGIKLHKQKGYYSDNQYVLKTDKTPPPKAEKSKHDLKEFLEGINLSKITEIESINEFHTGKDMPPYAHVKTVDGEDHFFNAKYVDSILSEYSDAEIAVSHDGMMIFSKENKTVGVVMARNFKPELHNKWKKEKKGDLVSEYIMGKLSPNARPKTSTNKAASGSEYAKDSNLSGIGEPFADGKVAPNAIDMPEIIEIIGQINGGKLPLIKKKLAAGVAGWFKYTDKSGRFGGKGSIEILASLFKNPELARKVVAHELGHMVDWLPDKTLKRGNILGRIASLKGHMKGIIPKKPGALGALTEIEKSFLNNVATKLAGNQPDKWVDEEITKSMPITPDDVLNIWNSIAAEDVSPALVNYVKGLSTADKKSVVKEALKGRVAKELKSFATEIKFKTGAKIKIPGKAATKEEVAKIYKDLIEQELIKRELVHNNVVMQELKDFTQKWKPFDPGQNPSYTKYRFSGKELYADAISALMTNPSFLQKTAPVFYKSFFNYMETKPAVARAYTEVQGLLNKSPEDLARHRKENVIGGFEKGFAARTDAITRGEKKEIHYMETVFTYLANKHEPILKEIRKIENLRDKNGFLNIRAKQATELRAGLEELQNMGTKIDAFVSDMRVNILGKLKDGGIDLHDLGYYMFQRRVITERKDIANPLGNYEEISDKDLKIIMNDWGPEKTAIIKQASKDFRKVWKEYIIDPIEKTGWALPELLEYIKDPTKEYVNFSVHKHLEKQYGGTGAARIYRQIGTVEEIENPVISTIFKGMSLFRAVESNRIKQLFEDALGHPSIGILTEAKLKYSQDFKKPMPVPADDPDLGIFTVIRNGKPVNYYGPKHVIDTFNSDPARVHAILKIFRALGWFPRTVFVSKNPVWMLSNLPKDFFTTVKNLPEVKIRAIPALAKMYMESYPEVVKYIFKGIMSPTIKDMAKEGMFPQQRMWGSTDNTPQEEIMTIAKKLILDFDHESAKESGKAVKAFMKVWNGIDHAAATTELVSKVAAYKYLLKHSNKDIKQVGTNVRNRSGTPNIAKKGKAAPVLNNLFPFSTVRINGLVSTYASYKEAPGSYMFKTLVFNIGPKLINWALRYGTVVAALAYITDTVDDNPDLSDEDKDRIKKDITNIMPTAKQIQMAYKNIGSYDMAHYNCIPLYIRADGKTAYLKIPEDYEGQMFSNITGALAQKKILGPGGLLDAVSAINPYNSNPLLSVPYKNLEYFAFGGTPVDSWRGQPILTDQEQLVGGAPAVKRMGKWSWSNLGGNLVYKPAWDNLETDRSDAEKFLNSFPGNILKRFVNVSDAGVAEEIRDRLKSSKKEKAKLSIMRKDALIELMNGKQITTEQLLLVFTQKDHILKSQVEKLILKKAGNVYLTALSQAQSNEEKAIILNTMLENNFLLRQGEPKK